MYLMDGENEERKEDFNETVSLTYLFSDSNGGTIDAIQSLSITSVNDDPVVSGRVNLGLIDEDNELIISSDQLLSKASDIDNDSLSITNLKITRGQWDITDNKN